MNPTTCPPRFGTPRAVARLTHGPALGEIARRLGVELMPWQRDLAAVALEHSAGRMAYRDVAVTVPRQSGKTTLMLALIIHRLLAAPAQNVAYGAQTRLAARGKLMDTLWPWLRSTDLAPMFRLSRGTGSETLYCKNGSKLKLLSTEESAGHGETLDLVVLDECWAMTQSVEQATRPAMATKRNAQIWMLSTAGTTKSSWWRSKTEAGRLQTETGTGKGLAYFEWSAGPDQDPFDRSTWPSFMPALGHTIDADIVESDLAVMAPNEWLRAYANLWPDETGAGWGVIQEDVWSQSAV